MSTTATAKKTPAKRTAAKKVAKPVVMTVNAPRFAAALKRIATFASKDDTLPMINSVCVEYHAGVLTLVATDRFKLGAETVDLVEDVDSPKTEDWTLQIAVRDVAVIVAKLRGERERIAITLFRDVPNAIPGGEPHNELDINGVRVGFAAQFPEWRKLVKGALAEPEATSASASQLNPDHLKPLMALGRDVVLRLPADPLRMLLAFIPGRFVGIVMPIRPHGDIAKDLANTFGVES